MTYRIRSLRPCPLLPTGIRSERSGLGRRGVALGGREQPIEFCVAAQRGQVGVLSQPVGIAVPGLDTFSQPVQRSAMVAPEGGEASEVVRDVLAFRVVVNPGGG